MSAGEPQIRDAREADLPAIQEIYADQVLHGVSSWEEEPPDLDEMRRRFEAIRNAGYPYRVALRGAQVVGYAYASAYRPRPAYRHTVENSIYISQQARRTGIGGKLLSDLIEQCSRRGYRQMIAVIGDSDNAMSIDFHEKMGFRRIGVIKAIGYKFDRWLDSVIMQRPLGEADKTPPG